MLHSHTQPSSNANRVRFVAGVLLLVALLPSASRATLPASVVQKRGDFCFAYDFYATPYTAEQLSWTSQFNVVVTAEFLPPDQVSQLHAAGCKLFFYDSLSSFYDPSPWVNTNGMISPGNTCSSSDWYLSILGRYPLTTGASDWLLMPLDSSGKPIGYSYPSASGGTTPLYYYDPTIPDFTTNRIQHIASLVSSYGYDGVFFDETHYSAVVSTSQAIFQARHPQLPGEASDDYYDRLCEIYDAGEGQFFQQLKAALPNFRIFTNQGYRDERDTPWVGTPLYTYYLPYADYDLTESYMTTWAAITPPVNLFVDGQGVQSVNETYVHPWYDPNNQWQSTALYCQILVNDPLAEYHYTTKVFHLNYGLWRYLPTGGSATVNGISYPICGPTLDKEAIYEGVAAALLMGQSSYYGMDLSSLSPVGDEVYFVDMGAPHTEGSNYVYNSNPDSSGTEFDSGGQVAWRLYDNGFVVVNDSYKDATVTVDPSLIPPGVTGLWDVFNSQPVADFMTSYTMSVPTSHYYATNQTVTTGRLFAFMRSTPTSTPLSRTIIPTQILAPAEMAASPPVTWNASGLGVGSDEQARVLWTSPDGRMDAWSVDNAGDVSNGSVQGPFTGYTARRIACGGDGLTRVIWLNNDGTTSFWIMGAVNSFQSSHVFGPFPGWMPADISVGTDNLARILWTNSDGRAVVWSVDNNGVPSSDTTFYGPFPGYTAQRIACGVDGLTRLLWASTDGTASLWLMGEDNIYRSFAILGPFSRWAPIGVSVGSDGYSRLMWRDLDGRMIVWSVDASGTPFNNQTCYGPYAGYMPDEISCGADGLTRVLWNNTNGTTSLWLMNPNNTLNTHYQFALQF